MASANPKLVLHFPIAAEPGKVLKTLRTLLYAEEPILKAEELDELTFAQNTDTNRFREARILAEKYLGLLETTKTGIVLTPRASVILQKREAIQYDLLHYLFSIVWSPENPTELTRSWFYRVLCERLWTMQEVTVDLETRRTLTQEIDGQLRLDFQAAPVSIASISLGDQTMDGAIEWLRRLSPSVIEALEKRTWLFHRRSVCSPELFLLALSRSYQASGAALNMDALISPQRREETCRFCLLDPLQFDRMLDLILPLYARFISPGTRSGSYGRFVRFQRFIMLEDFASQ
jgi:hypothetical protein